MSGLLGRNARLLKSGVAIGLGKNISVKASAEVIKEYSMDSLAPAVTGAGKQSFEWSCERLYTDKTYLALLIAGTKFDLVFAPQGSAEGDGNETWKNCSILNCERTASETGGLLEKISGQAESVELPT